MTAKREGSDIYSRVGNLEARVDNAEEDISGLRSESDHSSERLTTLEQGRAVRKGQMRLLWSIFSIVSGSFLEHWGLISKFLHWLGW